jgi:hypothetical protein
MAVSLSGAPFDMGRLSVAGIEAVLELRLVAASRSAAEAP